MLTVKFLDDTEHAFQIESRKTGAELLGQVCHHLNTTEDHYFGLQYVSNSTSKDRTQSERMRWMDTSKPIKQQVKKSQGPLIFKVRFYTIHAAALKQEPTIHQFYLQIRKDIAEKKLALNAECILSSYAIEAEFGDRQLSQFNPNNFFGLQVDPDHFQNLESTSLETYRLDKAHISTTAKFNFLNYATGLDLYGIELHKATDIENKKIQIGVSPRCDLVVFENGIKRHTFTGMPKVSSGPKLKWLVQHQNGSFQPDDKPLIFNMETKRSFNIFLNTFYHQYMFLVSRTSLVTGEP